MLPFFIYILVDIKKAKEIAILKCIYEKIKLKITIKETNYKIKLVSRKIKIKL